MDQFRVLLVWEMIPEHLEVYDLRNLTSQEYERVIGAHGTFLGGRDNEHTLWLNEWLGDKTPDYDSSVGEQEPLIIDSLGILIVHSGAIL